MMNKYYTREEFQRLQSDIAAGNLRVKIPRSIARQFFFRVDNSSTKATTDESAIIQKLIVWAGVITSPVLFIICAFIIAGDLGWLAAFAIPIVGIFWTVLAGFTSESGYWLDITGALAMTFIIYLVWTDAGTLALFVFTLSLWVHRMTSMIAEYFLVQIVTSSFDAYAMLVDHVTVEEAA